MKHVIVKASQLGTECWSAKRFTGHCHECPRVEKCTLPEAKVGKINYYNIRIASAKSKIKRLRKLRRRYK